MKTLRKTLLIAGLVSGFAPLSFAGPGIQNLQSPNSSAVPPAANGACERMLVRNTGPTAGRVPFLLVACTPEMKANDAACQSHCHL
jgi:hypothetical protein